METIKGGRRHLAEKALLRPLLGALLLIGVMSADGAAQQDRGWKLEPNVNPPSYAVIEPVATNLNIEALVLTCEAAGDHRVLQFQLYMSEAGPLLPAGADPQSLRRDPRAELQIDGRIYPVSLFFAEDYVVLADAVADRIPLVSDRLLDGVQRGQTMVLRFDLVAKRAGQRPAFDGEATIDLKAAPGGAAVAAVRHCVEPSPRPRASSVGPTPGRLNAPG